MEKYDIAIIGSGPGGYAAALEASQQGRKVCIIEKDLQNIGGVCLNQGCIPTKSLINSSSILQIINKASSYGIDLELKKIDSKKMVEASQQAIDKLKQGLLYFLKKNNIDLIEGTAKIIDVQKIQITPNATIVADNIIIATGSSPKPIPGMEFNGRNIITSSEAIKLDYIPKNILIVGGGAIGVEFACIYNNLGSEVVIVEMMQTLLPGQDEDITALLKKSLMAKGIKVLTDTKIEETLIKEELKPELILIAVGRVPNTKDSGLEEIGVELEDTGFIKVNQKMQTSISNIYAVGDVLDSYMLAHMASKEAEIAVGAILGGNDEVIKYENIPNALYSEPEVASLGLTEKDLKEKSIEYSVGRCYYKANPRAVTSKKEDGLIKVIIDPKSRKILGVHIIGENATEILHEHVIVKENDLTIDSIIRTVHAHPTFSEITASAYKNIS